MTYLDKIRNVLHVFNVEKGHLLKVSIVLNILKPSSKTCHNDLVGGRSFNLGNPS